MFLDIEKLAAGKFDDRLLSGVKQAKNFILVLSSGALERCMNDTMNKDWVHRVSSRNLLSVSHYCEFYNASCDIISQSKHGNGCILMVCFACYS